MSDDGGWDNMPWTGRAAMRAHCQIELEGGNKGGRALMVARETA